MKKLSIIMALIMVLSVLSCMTVSAVSKEPGYEKKIPITGSVFGPDTQGAITEITVNDGVIKMKRIAADGEIKLEVNNDNDKKVMAEDCDFFQFYADITEYSPSTDLHTIVYTRDASFTFRQSYDGFEYKLYQDGAWTDCKTDEYGRFTLPAGFKGWVRIDMSTLGTVNYKDNGFACFAIRTDENPLGGTGKSIYFSDFCLVKALPDVEPIPITNSTISASDQGANTEVTVTNGVIKMKRIAADGTIKLEINNDNDRRIMSKGRKYLQFKADISEYSPDADMHFIIYTRDSSYTYHQSGFDYKLYQNGIWSDHKTDEYGRFILPWDFNGYVRIDTATLGNVNYESNGFACFAIWTDENPSGTLGKAMYFSDFSLVNDGAYPQASEPGAVVVKRSNITAGESPAGEVTVTDGKIQLKRIADGEFRLEVNNDARPIKSLGHEYFQFDVDISEYSPNADMHFRTYTRDSKYCYYQSSDGGYQYKLLKDGEWIDCETDEYGRFNLPAGYKGPVRIVVSSLKGNVDYEKDGFTCFAIWSDENPLGGTGKSIYFSNFCFASETTDVFGSFEDVSVSVGDDLTMNYFVNVHDNSEYTVRFTCNGKEIVIEPVVIADGELKFTFTNINPQCMGDNVKAELLRDGEVVDTKESFSVKDYCIALVAEDENYKEICSALLNYGAEAQKYQNYKTDALCTEGVEWFSAPEDVAVENAVRSMTKNSGDTMLVKSASLVLGNTNRIMFKIATDYTSVKLGCGDDLADVTSDVEIKNGFGFVYTDELLFTQNSTVFTVVVESADAKTTVQYNVNAYVSAKTGDSAVGNLIKALYALGEAGRSYIN